MTYTTSAAFSKKVASIKKGAASLRSEIQSALVDAVYLCLANSGGTTPFQQILDAVGNTAHRQGITAWMETFAPVRMAKEKVLLNKTEWDKMDRDAALADFDKFIADTGMNAPESHWYVLAKESNTTVSIFNLDTSLDNFLKKLEKNGLGELAKKLRLAEQAYMADALRAEMGAANAPQVAVAA
jgi:hypothetical protein